MTIAYVFVQISATDPTEALSALRAIAGVKQAHLLMGPTDCIAFIEGADLEALGEALIAIRAVDGVASTDTRMPWPV